MRAFTSHHSTFTSECNNEDKTTGPKEDHVGQAVSLSGLPEESPGGHLVRLGGVLLSVDRLNS